MGHKNPTIRSLEKKMTSKIPIRKTVAPQTLKHFPEFNAKFFNDTKKPLLVMMMSLDKGKIFVKVWDFVRTENFLCPSPKK